MSKMDGLDNVLRKLDAEPEKLAKAAIIGMKIALSETVDYGKRTYARSSTNKGFTDRTTNLRNSWKYTVSKEHKLSVKGWVHAGWGVGDKPNYAYWVETRWDGKFAFLYPSVNDKKVFIFETIATLCKLTFKK